MLGGREADGWGLHEVTGKGGGCGYRLHMEALERQGGSKQRPQWTWESHTQVWSDGSTGWQRPQLRILLGKSCGNVDTRSGPGETGTLRESEQLSLERDTEGVLPCGQRLRLGQNSNSHTEKSGARYQADQTNRSSASFPLHTSRFVCLKFFCGKIYTRQNV